MTTPTQPTAQELVELISGNRLFKAIDPERLQQVADELIWVSLAPGGVLFEEGDDVKSFFFVIDGYLEVTRAVETDPDGTPTVLSMLEPKSVIGAAQILKGGWRNSTVTAKGDCTLVEFPRDAFDRLLSKGKSVVQEIGGAIIPRLYEEELIKVLPQVFGALDPATFKDLKSRAKWMHMPRGHIVCFQGEPTDSFYVLISGRLQVMIRSNKGQVHTVGEVAPGHTVGEMGVLTGEERSATVVASRDSELVRFSKTDFDELSDRFPGLLRHMVNVLVRRLKQVHSRSFRGGLSSNLLIAPATDGVSLDAFTNRLKDALYEHGRDAEGRRPCLLLTSEEVDQRLGVPGISQSSEGQPDDLRLRAWLSDQERKSQMLLLQTDATVTEWTHRCIRNADEVMFVARASAEPATSDVAREVQDQEMAHQATRRKSLVLIHEDDVDRPRGTRAWLDEYAILNTAGLPKPPGRHFHIRRNSESDFQRIGRFVTHREVGLVLSGGGARGFAHVGCIRAMTEQQIPIDMIGGVSMGSLVSAAYAYDPGSFDETIERVKSQLQGVLSDVTVPIVSIAKGKRFDERLQGWFGDLQIEDLWLPYFCVTSNLTQANIFAHDTGPLWLGVRASGTLPGISAPVVQNGDLLFDGCLLDNLPMDVMRERMYESLVIAVDVVPPHDLKVDVQNSLQSPSGWRLLWSKLNPFAKRIDLPNIFCILQRAGELGSVYGRQRLIDANIADIYLRPSVQDIHIADFKAVGRSAQIGYDECGAQLAEWWKTIQTSDQN